jgi:hypothetical protein
MGVIELRARPGNHAIGRAVEGVGGGVEHRRVVVAAHHDGAALGVLGDLLEHGPRIGAVPYEVAEERVPIHAPPPGVSQARIERLEVGVDVGEECEAHSWAS